MFLYWNHLHGKNKRTHIIIYTLYCWTYALSCNNWRAVHAYHCRRPGGRIFLGCSASNHSLSKSIESTNQYMPRRNMWLSCSHCVCNIPRCKKPQYQHSGQKEAQSHGDLLLECRCMKCFCVCSLWENNASSLWNIFTNTYSITGKAIIMSYTVYNVITDINGD